MSEQLLELTLEPADNQRLARLCGQFDEHLKLIEKHFGVDVSARGNRFNIAGDPQNIATAGTVLTQLYRQAGAEDLDPESVHMALRESGMTPVDENSTINGEVRTRRKVIPLALTSTPKNPRQLSGRTENNRWVNFDGDPSLINQFADIRITEALPNSLRGRLEIERRVA